MLSIQEGDDRVGAQDLWRITCQKVIDILANDAKSPWYGQIGLANSPRASKHSDAIARSATFHSSIKPVHQSLEETGAFKGTDDSDRRAEIMAKFLQRYWDAIKAVNPQAFRDPKASMLQKGTGIYVMHMIFPRILADIYRAKKKWEVSDIRDQLDAIDDLKDPTFWDAKTGFAASIYGKKGFDILAKRLLQQYDEIHDVATAIL